MTSEFWSASSVSRGRIVSVDDSGENQTVVVAGFRGERFSGVLRGQPHGYSSNPPVDAVGNFLRLGSSDRLVALGYETPGRPRDLPTGSPALYNADGTIWKLLPGKADLDHGGKNSHLRNIERQKIEASEWHQVDAKAVYLGRPPYYPVMTSAGPSLHVFAGIGPAAPDTPSGSV